MRASGYVVSACVLAAIGWAVFVPKPVPANSSLPPDVKSNIAEDLREIGFVAWDAIEYGNGVLAVDGARHRSGRRYDLEVDPVTFRVIKRARKEESTR